MEGLEELTAVVPVRSLLPVAGKLTLHPRLWPTAIRQLKRLAAKGWWRRPPFLPIPDSAYLEFRSATMYGGGHGARLNPTDVIEWLEWCRQWPAASR